MKYGDANTNKTTYVISILDILLLDQFPLFIEKAAALYGDKVMCYFNYSLSNYKKASTIISTILKNGFISLPNLLKSCRHTEDFGLNSSFEEAFMLLLDNALITEAFPSDSLSVLDQHLDLEARAVKETGEIPLPAIELGKLRKRMQEEKRIEEESADEKAFGSVMFYISNSLIFAFLEKVLG